jgi:F-type H+-transporting ATPase subunit epsilon
MADTKQAGSVRCVIVTPESTSLDTHARSVTLPLDDGLRGVGRGHSPFIGRLGAGEVRIVGEQGGPADGVRRLFVEGGFVEVGHDSVTVITQRAIPAERIDAATARGDLERVTAERAVGDEAIDTKMRAEAAARALVRTAGRSR